MKMKTLFLLVIGILFHSNFASAALVGSWTFDGDLTNQIAGGSSLTTRSDSGRAIVESYDSATIGGRTATVANLSRLGYDLPGASGEHWLVMKTDAAGLTKQWTLMMDINFDRGFQDSYSALIQTNTGNSGDGDSFIHNGGVGINGDYEVASGADRVDANEWNRIAIRYNGSNMQYFVNGSRSNTVDISGYRFELDPELLLFVDNQQETSEVLINNLAFWNETLTDNEISDFGAVTAGAIAPVPVPGSAALLVPGLAALCMLHRRKQGRV